MCTLGQIDRQDLPLLRLTLVYQDFLRMLELLLYAVFVLLKVLFPFLLMWYQVHF